MSFDLKLGAGAVQIGSDGTATNNFILRAYPNQDGAASLTAGQIKLQRGNDQSESATIFTVSSAGVVTFAGGLGTTDIATLTESTGAAWTNYTPTITADTGTWSVLSIGIARYRRLGKTLFLCIDANSGVSSGSPTIGKISLPGGLTAASVGVMMPCFMNAAGTDVVGSARVGGGSTTIDFYKLNSAAFTGTNYFRVVTAIELA